MTDGKSGDAIFPVVVVKVDGITCRALIDSGAGSSYASAKLIDLVKKKPSATKTQRIDMLMSSRVTRMESYDVVIESVDDSYKIDVRLMKVNKGELLSIDNPRYEQLIQKHQHLRQVEILDHDSKQQLPIHVILGSGEYARIKTGTKPLVGEDGDPVAEKTKLGWFVMSPGADFDKTTVLLTQTSQSDYENLCRLDVLGIADSGESYHEMVYQDFKEQLQRSPDGWYEANLPWKPHHASLATNEQGSRRRLEQLVKKLQREGSYDSYDRIIQDQLQQGVIELAPNEASRNEFYLPHKAVSKQEAESTKLRIVYDASAKESHQHPSLNDCLYAGPPLQNLLWSILVRSRFYPVLLTGDLEKAFLQVRIKEEERDALRFFWRSPGQDKTLIYRFTRALFDLTCSPFLLGGVISQHLKSWELKYRDDIDKLLESHGLRKVHRIGAWVQRFIQNCRQSRKNRKVGPLDTTEIEQQRIWWIKRTQQDARNHVHFEQDKLQLNLQPNHQHVLECRGRIEGEYPVYLPDDHPYTEKVVEQAHSSSLHGGVAMTMAKMRETYWVPRLRQMTKRVRSRCWGCKKFRVKAYQSPPPGILPSTRTQGSTPFEVLGVDFAGPIRYHTRKKAEKKAYLALFGCSLTRAVHLELLKSLVLGDFIACLKRFVARRGKPKVIYSDNGSTFKAASTWLKKVEKDERLNSNLADLSIRWIFNLSRAPWWGRQFECLIGLFKRAFYKTIGNGSLKWEELEEVVIDVETALNNRLLSYVEDDIELPVLTPYSMMFLNKNNVPELDPHHIEEVDL